MNSKDEHFTDDEIIEALEHSRGMIYLAARWLNNRDIEAFGHGKARRISGRALDKRIQATPQLSDRQNDLLESLVDLAETKLFENIRQGDFRSIQLLLTTKGKDRGYVPRTETTGKDGEAIQGRVEYVARMPEKCKSAKEWSQQYAMDLVAPDDSEPSPLDSDP